MREILFRGKIIDDVYVTDKWVEGSFCNEAKAIRRLKGETEYTDCPRISVYNKRGNLPYFGNGGAPKFYVVHPETVGQYTGLTDKNGKKIYEGDIIYNSKWGKFVIIYNTHFGGFVANDIEGGCGWEFLDEIGEIEIIGNIHDDSDLLKGSAEE